MTEMDKNDPRFVIPLPGGKVARVPASVLEQYVEDAARPTHAPSRARPSAPVTIHIYAGEGGARVHARERGQQDVTAHSLSVDPSTGTSEWHTDWEYGECEYTDESGFPQRVHAWHRHPFGNEYAELYEG
jgi:hypothetical protein